jgi:predicted GIY-YIG superfamily endonuclease
MAHKERKVRPPYYWMDNPDRIVEVSKLCTSRAEFNKKYKGAYVASLKLAIHETICEHMVKGKIHNPQRCIYIIEFPNKIAYIGLTNNLKLREQQHKTNKNSIVFKHMSATNHSYEIKMLDDYMDEDKSSIRETYWYNHYKSLGYKLLNLWMNYIQQL